MKVSAMIRIQTEARDIILKGVHTESIQGQREVTLSIPEEEARALYAYLGNKLRQLGKGEA